MSVKGIKIDKTTRPTTRPIKASRRGCKKVVS